MIDSATAVMIATEALIASGDAARPLGLEAVYDYDEAFVRGPVPFRAPSAYGAHMEGSWIVYCDQRDGFRGIRSSFVVVVDRETGEVRYIGSARDEG